MRRAFVFQLSDRATQDHLEGRIEHVDSGRTGHFVSIDDIVCFVRQVLADLESVEPIRVNEAFSTGETSRD